MDGRSPSGCSGEPSNSRDLPAAGVNRNREENAMSHQAETAGGPVTIARKDAEESEVCPTCYETLDSRLVGIPEGCQHKYCLECIQAWLKNSNSCPACRHRFSVLHVFRGEERVDTLPVQAAQVEMAPPVEFSLEDVVGSTGYNPGRGHIYGTVTTSEGTQPLRVERTTFDLPAREERSPTPGTSSGQTQRVVPSGAGEATGSGEVGRPHRAMAARIKYQRAIMNRPPQIPVPLHANPLTYHLSARLNWARRITLTLPLPRSSIEARYRIQSPRGEPFPVMLPKWATFWHAGATNRNSGGRLYRGRNWGPYELCKLLWLEGFSRSAFPSLQ